LYTFLLFTIHVTYSTLFDFITLILCGKC
jgi:hypothetical protein